ncbi:uncharacterized protein TEOVI_000042000 [Trypanosoma equiperdum]|uniref:Uncharacterized protein n=4 Tax=Trypanozoon TaxID=39700 RepID=Q38FM2_TRYB2|nr:hypothetical protein, conserved [Trypanosoma brucei gambiense DAL972]XP_803608.1 hypothetical protein, conserved [Trypanosoma brucei brucei TREU927]RHW70443.1 hypothetical protein DPX39_090008900 [Trypanosoma brucei equiperdum]SCU67302.1 hypothetical protein, conserved [Trypanosoma equiperdum]EAN76398.1 hypothetical protein, conserved [Trypanosoma brucei brucei TREU927]CBH14076.1 hypothetical protein, conserved [Trypanosoma brucei gambiense DAL972]|eukprot:XP_011776347.1 hypothetical protein, conserved [Trypanosoma brucei gambiense DAL972]
MSSKSSVGSISSIQRDQEYLHSHNVRGMLELLIADVILERPENACEYFALWASRKQRERNAENTSGGQAPTSAAGS